MQLTNCEQDYHNYHLELLKDFTLQILKHPPFSLEHCTADDALFLQDLQHLWQNSSESQFVPTGQHLMCMIVTRYPHLMPLLYRDLLWFFGGDCLHFMPDQEIAEYQRLDERRYEALQQGEKFNYAEARRQIFNNPANL